MVSKPNKRPLGKWWDHLGHTFGKRGNAAVLPVGYGGNFAVRMDMIRAVNSSLWSLLVAGPARGANQDGEPLCRAHVGWAISKPTEFLAALYVRPHFWHEQQHTQQQHGQQQQHKHRQQHERRWLRRWLWRWLWRPI